MISKERLCEVILSPLMTEKSYLIASQGAEKQVSFKVRLDSTKTEIKEAVKFLFEVEPSAVRTLRVKGKTRMFKQISGKTQDWKKAVVTLKAGDDINFLTDK
jgi:large subunit ribosomal protein L23